MSVDLISANHAAAKAAAMAGRANREGRGFGGGVYPITPQTECIEQLCREPFDKGAVVRVESEHSAMAVCIGQSLAGARAFTASSSNGLAYMTENVFAAAFYRLPIVMMAVNRTLGPPWNIWVDHGDTLLLRDAGWIQLYCEDNQEVLDSILLGYRLAEDARVLTPVMVCQDAFVLSHTMMLTDVPDQEQVDRYLPLLDLPHRVAHKPVTVGGLDFPHETEVHRRQHAEAMERAFDVYAECQDAFESVFGRRPADPVVPYRMEDADLVLISMGTTAATVRVAVDEARENGMRVGALRVRMFRPFPERVLRSALAGARRVGVIDRDISLGHGGVLWSETRGTAPGGSLVQNYVVGLGGGDIRPQHVTRVLEDLASRDAAGAPEIMEIGE
jgi:pyruvate/2-oxoacid:ferredoxin oxidoreductase alpha subunit